MKKEIYLVLCFLHFSHICSSQSNTNQAKTRKFRSLYIVDCQAPVSLLMDNIFILPAEIDTSYALPTEKYKEICNLLKVDRIVFTKVKTGIKLLTINDVFDLYGIKKKYQKYTIHINESVFDNSQRVLISSKSIDKINIVNRFGKSYIDIIERSYLKNKSDKRMKDEEFVQ